LEGGERGCMEEMLFRTLLLAVLGEERRCRGMMILLHLGCFGLRVSFTIFGGMEARGNSRWLGTEGVVAV